MFEVEVVRVGAALAALVAALDPDRLEGAIATDLFAGLDRIERLAWAGKTLRAATVADQQAGAGGGGGTGTEGLARSSGTGTGAARDQVAACRALTAVPVLAAALRRHALRCPGRPDHPGLHRRPVRPAPAGRTGEAGVAGGAPRGVCPRRAAADPDPEATNRRIRGGRRLRRYTDPDDSWNLCARGTPQAGAAFHAVLDPLVDAAIRAARGSDDHEPFEAHAFDALMNLADLAARRQAGEAPGQADDSPAAGASHTAPGERTARPEDADPAVDAAAPAHDTDPKTPAPEAEAAADADDVSRDDRGRTRPGEPVGDEPRLAPAARTPAKPTDRTEPEQDRTGKPTAPTSTAPADPSPRGPDGADRERSRRRSDPRYLALLRVDLTALAPRPVLKLVITRGIDVLHVTHLGRGPTAAQRIPLAWTSPHCSALGCPRTRIQVDHRLDWAHTRHTRLDELDPLCPYHHDLKTPRLGPGPRHRTTRLRPTPRPPPPPPERWPTVPPGLDLHACARPSRGGNSPVDPPIGPGRATRTAGSPDPGTHAGRPARRG